MKKIIALILALIFSLLLLVSCGEGNSGSQGSVPASSTPASSGSGIGNSQGDNEGSYMPDW